MNDHEFEDATVGMAKVLRSDKVAAERNGVEDRTAADVLRKKGFSPERIRRWFGYIPQPMVQQERREEAYESYEAAALVSSLR